MQRHKGPDAHRLHLGDLGFSICHVRCARQWPLPTQSDPVADGRIASLGRQMRPESRWRVSARIGPPTSLMSVGRILSRFLGPRRRLRGSDITSGRHFDATLFPSSKRGLPTASSGGSCRASSRRPLGARAVFLAPDPTHGWKQPQSVAGGVLGESWGRSWPARRPTRTRASEALVIHRVRCLMSEGMLEYFATAQGSSWGRR
jgi:hypothetical protein